MAKNDIYVPNSWCIDDHIIVYDVVLSSCKTKIYILFNSLIHTLDPATDKRYKPDKKTRNYQNVLRKLLCFSKDVSFDSEHDILINSENIEIEKKEWINYHSYVCKHTLVIHLQKQLAETNIKLEIDIKTIKRTLDCHFDGIYDQHDNIAAILLFKNENAFLDTWIKYYLYLGVNTFYIYNNNPENMQCYTELKKKYGNTIQFIDWGYTYQFPNGQAQLVCYNHALNLLRGRYNWLLYTDIDEFAVLKDNSLKNLTDLLTKHELKDTASVSYQCMWFGCSHNVSYTPDNFLRKLIYTSNEPVSTLEKHRKNYVNAKCIHNPQLVDIVGVHVALSYNGEHVQLKPEIIRFNHYYTLTDWGKDRSFTKGWKSDASQTHKKLCNCKVLCKVKNTELIDKHLCLQLQ